MIFIFNNKHFITSGVNEKVPLLQQIAMWELIHQLPVDKDYLQVFYLTAESAQQQRIRHTQEEPEYAREYVFNTDTPVIEKVYVIDDETHSTMLLASEY